jgi:fibronectin-binding autotransporter adhesin
MSLKNVRTVRSSRLLSDLPKARRAKGLVVLSAAMTAVGLFSAEQAQATSATWALSPTDSNWVTTGSETNWSTGAGLFPGSTSVLNSADVATFNNASSTTGITINSTTLNVKSLTFDTAAAAFTIGSTSGNSLLLSSGGAVTLGTTGTSFTGTNTTETISAPITLEPATATTAGTYTFINNSTTATDVLSIGGTIMGGTTSSTVTLTLNGANTGLNTVSGSISNGSASSLGVTKTGGGKWILSASNSYSGGTNFTGGTLVVTNASGLGSGTVNFAGSSMTLQLLNDGTGSNGTITYGNNITFSSGGNDTVTLGNNGSGNTGNTIALGTLTLSSGTNNFAVQGNNSYQASFTNIVLTTNGLLGDQATPVTIKGAISDTGSGHGFFKANTGTLFLTTAAASSYTGATTIYNGAISLNAMNDIGPGQINFGGLDPTTSGQGTSKLIYTGAGDTVTNAINLSGTTGGVTIENDGSGALVFNGSFSVGGAGSKTLTLTGSNTAGNNTFNSAIVDNSSTNKTTVTVAGTGRWIFSGNNTYSGLTTVGGNSTVVLSGDNSAASGGVTVSGSGGSTGLSTLDVNSATALGTGTLTLNNGHSVIDNTSGSDLAVTTNNPISPGSFTFTGTNSLNLGTGTVTFTSHPTWQINSNTLTLGGTLNGGTGAYIIKAGAGTLALTGSISYTGTTSVGLSTNPNAGTLLLSGDNSAATGGFTVFNATLDINSPTALGTGKLTFNNGANPVIDNTSGSAVTETTAPTQAWAGSFTFTGSSNLDLGTGAVTLSNSPTVTVTAGTLTVDGVIGGLAGQLTKAGAGTLVLTGANNYTGPNVVNAGTLTLSGSGTLGSTGNALAVNNPNTGAGTAVTLNLSTTAGTTTGSLSGTIQTPSSGTNTATINNGGQLLTVNQTAIATFPGTITGNGGFTLGASSTKTLTLSGTNTYTGPTLVSASALELAQEASLYNNTPANWTAANITVASGATLIFAVGSSPQFTSSDLDTIQANTKNGLNNNGFEAGSAMGFDTTAGNFTYASAITDSTGTGGGSVGVSKFGANTLTLPTADTYSGNTTIFAGALQADDGTGLPNASLLVLSGGVLQSNGSTTFARPLGVSSDEVQFTGSGGGFAAGNSVAQSVTLSSGATLVWNSTANFLTNGAPLILGSTTANAGVTFTNNIDLNGAQREVRVIAGIGGDSATLSGVLSSTGTGGLNKTGSGTLTLNNSNTYSGATTVTAGTLLVANSAGSATGTGAVAVNSPALLGGTGTISGVVTVASGATIFAGPTFGVNGKSASVLTVGTGSTLAGNVNLDITTSTTSDKIVFGGAGAANLTGTLNVDQLSGVTFASGQSYDLFGFSSETGTFGNVPIGTSVMPASFPTLTGGLTWNTSTLYTNGIISIGGSGNASASWFFNGSGNWETATNWTGSAVPGVAGNFATFSDPTVNTPVTATLTANETVGGLVFNGNGAPVTIAATGSNTLTLNNNGSGATINVTAGNPAISAPLSLAENTTVTTATSTSLTVSGNIGGTGKLTTAGTGTVTLTGSNNYAGGTHVTGGILAIQSTTALPTASALTVDSGAKVIVNRNGHGEITLDLASLSDGGLIDLQNNAMVIHGADASTYTTVNGLLKSGYTANADWSGTSGITTSTLAGSSLYTLGEALVGSDLKVGYAYYGDADMSGIVDGTDYSMIDTGFAGGGTGWQYGDFNYDGHVDGSDYSLIDNAFNTQTGSAPAAQLAVNTSEIATGGSAAVPEPTSLGLLGIGAIGLMNRRRRRI